LNDFSAGAFNFHLFKIDRFFSSPEILTNSLDFIWEKIEFLEQIFEKHLKKTQRQLKAVRLFSS